MAVLAADFVTVLQIAIAIGILNSEVAIEAKQLIACGDIDIIIVEGNTTQTAIGSSAVEIDLAFVPVDVLLPGPILEIDGKYSTMTLPLLTASDDRCGNKFREFHVHFEPAVDPSASARSPSACD